MDTRREVVSATQARVIDAAITVLGKVGVDRLSMQAVADTADVALRTLYNHFPSKEALVIEAYNEMVSPFVEAVDALPSVGSPQERLHRFVESLYATYTHDRRGLAAVLGVTGTPQFDARVAEVRAWRRAELRAILRPAVRSGALRLPLKQAIAISFLWTAFATYSSMVDASGLDADTATRLAIDSMDSTLFRKSD
jgi:AcrR family transcriptional regulator